MDDSIDTLIENLQFAIQGSNSRMDKTNELLSQLVSSFSDSYSSGIGTNINSIRNDIQAMTYSIRELVDMKKEEEKIWNKEIV